jgi:hypothetical protein
MILIYCSLKRIIFILANFHIAIPFKAYWEYHLSPITLFSEEILPFLEQKTEFFSRELPHCNTVFRFAVCCQVWTASTFFYKGVNQ